MRRTAAGALAAILVALLVGLPAGNVAAQDRPFAQLALASQTTWVRSTTPFTVRIDVDGVRRPGSLDLAIAVHRAVTSRSQFARTLDGDLLGPSVYRDRVAFDELRFDAGGAIPVTISLPDLRPGVYPVAIDLVDTGTGEAVTSLVTHLVRVPDEPVATPLQVAWVQAYGTDPALQPDGGVTIPDDDLDELRTIAAQLDAGAPMTVVPTPETIDALASLDAGRTASALGRLLAGHQVLSTPFVDLDVSALIAADRVDDLARQRVEGDRVLQDALGVTGDTRTWSLSGAVTRASLRALQGLGVNRVVLEERAMEPLPASATGGLTLTRPFALDGAGSSVVGAVAVDPGIEAHFEEPDDVLGAHQLLADLAVLHFDSPGTSRGVVVRPPDGWHPSEVLLSTVFANLASSPVLEPVTVDGLFDAVDELEDDGEPVVRDLAPAEPDAPGVAPDDIDRARSATEAYASLLADPDRSDVAVLERLVLVAQSSDLRGDAGRAYVDAVLQRVADTTSNVRVLGDRTYRLTAREGTIPLTLVNDNPFPVRVDVELTSDKLTFTGSDEVGRLEIRDVVLDAERTTTRAIPVKARTSGAFPLRVAVRSPGGRLPIGDARFTITSTVASGVGLVLSAGAALFLLAWWASHWRTVRRARRLVPPE